jgi:hypothetical protein
MRMRFYHTMARIGFGHSSFGPKSKIRRECRVIQNERQLASEVACVTNAKGETAVAENFGESS